jgi:tetratricopeptide (TPR) repeat protein
MLAGRLTEASARLDALEAPRDDVASGAEILSWRSRIAWLTGRWEAALTNADEAVAILSGTGDSVALARALARRSQLAMLRNLPEAPQYALEAIDVARRTGDRLAEVNGRINLFTALAGRGVAPDHEDVLQIVEVAASIADYEDAYRALVNLVWCAPGYLTHDSVERVLSEARQRFPDLVRPRALGLYLELSLVDMMISAGRFADARVALDAAPFVEDLRPRALATEEAQRILPMLALAVPAYVLLGRADEARALAEEALELLGSRAAAAFSALPIARGLAAMGAYDVLRGYVDAQQSRGGGPIDGRLATSIAAGRGLLALHEGRAEDAAAIVRVRAERERADGWLYDAACLDLVLADALEAAGEADEARALRERADDFFVSIGCRFPV